MKRIKVTGYLYIEEDEYDSGPLGPLTEEADMKNRMNLGRLDDLTFELAEED